MKFKKWPEATTNTYAAEIDGLLIEQCGDEDKFYKEKYTVFFTSDVQGESLSLSGRGTPFQFHIKFDELEELIAYTRLQRKDGLKQ